MYLYEALGLREKVKMKEEEGEGRVMMREKK